MAHSLQFAKKLLETSKETDYYERLSVGILVGGLKTLELSDRDRPTISIACSVPDDSVAGIGWCSRSLWKPKHSFEGLLYRVGEHVIFADPDEGDTVATLESLFSVKIDDVPVLFCKGKRFGYDGVTDLGLKVVSPTDTTVLFKASVLSRKVMLCARSKDDDDDDDDDEDEDEDEDDDDDDDDDDVVVVGGGGRRRRRRRWRRTSMLYPSGLHAKGLSSH